jgi:hypothetical protein
MKGQDPWESVDLCEQYAQMFVTRQDYTTLVECIAAATRQQWVKLDQWKKWYSVSERLRLLMGNIVM